MRTAVASRLPPSAPVDVAGPRPLSRRRGLPSGRAVAGAFLVAVAAVGIFAAYSRAASPVRDELVVAARSLPAGTRLGPGDLATAAMDVPASLARRAFAQPRALLGAVVVGPLEAGELVQASDVMAGTATGRQVSFPIESARALNGRLVRGERVDLLATYTGGAGEGYTEVVARDVAVVEVAERAAAIGAAGTVVLTVALDDARSVLAVTHAARTGGLTVVRAAGDGGPGSYRPAPPPED